MKKVLAFALVLSCVLSCEEKTYNPAPIVDEVVTGSGPLSTLKREILLEASLLQSAKGKDEFKSLLSGLNQSLDSLIFLSDGTLFNAEVKVKKILDSHDEVMPKLGQVMSLRKQVLAKATELGSDSEEATSLRNLAAELDGSRKGMMTWMNDWSKSSKPHVNGESTEEEQKAYFAAEMERVTKVKDDINGAIASANKALK